MWDVQNRSFLRNVNRLNLSGIHISEEEMIKVFHSLNTSLINLRMYEMKLKIKTLLNEACQIPSVRVIRLKSNHFSSLDDHLFLPCSFVEELDVTANKIRYVSELAFKPLERVTTLRLGHNQMTVVPRAIRNLPVLETLDLSFNSISNISCSDFAHLVQLTELAINSQGHKGLRNLPSNLLEGLTSLRKLHAGNTNTETLHPDTFSRTPHLSYLDISKNVFTTLTAALFQNIPELTILIINKARLQSLDFLIHANLSSIQSLQMKQNELAVINETLIHSLPALTYLSLEENTFTCDCNNAWFIRWAKDDNHTQVVGAGGFTCNYPADLRGYKLLDLDTESCNVDVGFFYFISTTILVMLTLLGSIFYHFLRWQVVYAYYLFLAFLYNHKRKRTQKEPRDIVYDAFVSYNVRDEPWVLEKLMPELEDQQGWKLCLHHRDFEPGKPILDNIVEGIYSSRKTLCLISRDYLESEWCSREIQVASFRLFDEKKDVLILVFLENIPPASSPPITG
ncbi:hypothetical protein SKAU_G00153550 [Synaphobranchus kaupii]|uniref:TIR domain-containing protein n=1 Tax=Synaphobranchus kaupii TaxID=118154 RepID=A0A9Q1IZ16_SYNKA|nr:hypothetical protein SKAU_G00153550 [Synaphobranchus kaupii]